MQPMIEIHYLNGRKRRFPDTSFIAEGESMASVIDIGLEDVTHGLVLYYKHYEPVRPSPGALDVQPDPAGLPSILYNDGYVVLVSEADISKVEKVYYEGKLELLRFSPGGDLVNLHKVNSAQMLYLNGEGVQNMRLKIAKLFTEMRKAFKMQDGGFSTERAIDEAVRIDLGVPKSIVDECLSFQSAYAMRNPQYAVENGLPYVSDDGELVSPDCDTEPGAPATGSSPSGVEPGSVGGLPSSFGDDDVESSDLSDW